MILQLALSLAVLLTALALVPGGAHLLELVNKLKLGEREYFIVQSIYRGWALVGFVVSAAFAANVWAAVLQRGHGAPFWLSVAAAALVLATLGVFFRWTQPVNKSTNDWSVQPEDLQPLRRQWEYSHAANAILTFMALCCATLAAVTGSG